MAEFEDKKESGGLLDTGAPTPEEVVEQLEGKAGRGRPKSKRGTGQQNGTVECEAPIGETKKQEDAPELGANYYMVVTGSRNRRPLSPEGQEYVANMENFLKKHKIRLVEMPNNGTYVATNGSTGIGLVFNEVLRAPSIDNEFIPACNHLDVIANTRQFDARMKELRLEGLESMVIIPKNDYIDMDRKDTYARQANRALGISQIAANGVKNTINLAEGAEFTVEDMAVFPIRLVTNQSEVAAHIRDMCPDGVEPYWQIGCAVEVCMDARYGVDRARNRNIDRDSYDWDCLFALGATVEFLDTRENGEHRFLPLVTLTVCESTVKSIKLLPFMLAIAEEVFIQQGYYLEPFKNWGVDNPNYSLNQLVIDPKTGNPSKPFETARDFEDFVKYFLDDPALAVDVRYGCWNHPSLDCLIYRNGLDVLADELQTLQSPDRINVSDLIISQVMFYSGIVMDNGVALDTRAIDYFRVVKEKNDLDILDAFRGYTDNPEDRIRAIAAAGWKNTPSAISREGKILESLYQCYKFILNADTICDMVDTTNNLEIIRNMRASSMGAFDFARIRDQARIYRQRDRSILRNYRTNRFNNVIGGFYRGCRR